MNRGESQQNLSLDDALYSTSTRVQNIVILHTINNDAQLGVTMKHRALGVSETQNNTKNALSPPKPFLAHAVSCKTVT
jgi:hypothetical protein